MARLAWAALWLLWCASCVPVAWALDEDGVAGGNSTSAPPTEGAGSNSTGDAGGAPPQVVQGCALNGFQLWGRVRVVNSFPDLQVQVVDTSPDLLVQKVMSSPDRCGKWQFVSSFPDFTVQFVTSFPDVRVRYVEDFPGRP